MEFADYPPVRLHTDLTNTACFAEALMHALAALPQVRAIASDGSDSAAEQFLHCLQFLAGATKPTIQMIDVIPYLAEVVQQENPDYWYEQGDPSELLMLLLSAVPALDKIVQWKLCEYCICDVPGCPSDGAAQLHKHTPTSWLVLQPRQALEDAWTHATFGETETKCAKCAAPMRAVTNPHDDPEVLVVVVQRWDQRGHKDATVTHWPLHFELDRSTGTTRFSLVAAIAHAGGTIRQGHYRTLVRRIHKNTSQAMWFSCDGPTASLVHDPHLFLQDGHFVPYMLFFTTK